MSGNGCAHVHTHFEQRGDDRVLVCDACGDERSRDVDWYADGDD